MNVIISYPCTWESMYGRAGNKRLNLNELKFDLNFVKLKQRLFKRHSSPYWFNTGVRDIENF